MHQIKNNYFITNDFMQINELKINFYIEIIKILLKKLMKNLQKIILIIISKILMILKKNLIIDDKTKVKIIIILLIKTFLNFLILQNKKIY